MPKQPEILFICGSPRKHTCEALLDLVEQGAKEAGAKTARFTLSQKHIDPCMGCGACSKTGVCVLVKPSKDSQTAAAPDSDNYTELTTALDRADAIAIIAPLYFAGPPAQLKALYDRLQPYWAKRYVLGQNPAPKRPAQLFILGGGGDAHGYEPLVAISKSALAVAGFTIEKVLNFVGFKAQVDVAPLPTEDEAANMAFGELAHLRKEVASQKDFEQRAFGAGGAYARFVRKSLEKIELQAELQQIEAEIAELKAGPPVISEPDPFAFEDNHLEEQVDADFEALRSAAKSTSAANEAAAAKKAQIIAHEDESLKDSPKE